MTLREEWSTWTSWRGSTRLVKHIAETIVGAIGGEPELCITASVLDDKEMFPTAAAFVEDVTPEALRDFHRLDLVIRDERLCVEVVLLRSSRGGGNEREESNVKLSIRWENPDTADLASHVARAACAALRRGHRRWLGRTEGSDGIPVAWRGRSLPQPPGAVRVLAKSFGGFCFALLLLSTISTLLPDAALPPWFALIVACAAGIGSARVVPALVPSIEIAEPGSTRLSRATRWASVTLLGLILAQIAKKTFGS